MYTPKHFEIKDRKRLTQFMRANPFAILIGVKEQTPIATHIPFVIIEEGEEIRLLAHVSKANEQWRYLEKNALVVFTGPHAYVSPKHYEEVKSVPTWNYAAVHAYGTPQILDSPEGRRRAVEELILVTEAGYLSRWKSLDSIYQDSMLNAIVAFEIKIERLEGKFKLSQNKLPGEQARISEEFLNSADTPIHGTGKMMSEIINKGVR